jgi:putrescine transport system ATP-binding protein
LQTRLQTTFVIVTHDQDEAMTVADRIAVMDRGRLAQVGTPVEVYERPASRWVAGFVGDVNLIEGHVTTVYPSFVMVERDGMRLRVAHAPVAPGPVAVALRPEKIRVMHSVPDGSFENGAAGTVTDIGYLGTMSLYKVRLDDGLMLKAAVMNEQRQAARTIHVNDRVWLSWAPEAGVLLTE